VAVWQSVRLDDKGRSVCVTGLSNERQILDSHCIMTNSIAKSYLKHKTLGFTLLELLVVMAIIGLLAAYVGPKYFASLGQSEQTTAKAQIAAFSEAVSHFRLDTGRYPSTAEGLNALMLQPANVRNWNGPYLAKEIPPDPWNNAYLYKFPGTQGRDFDLLSYGSDGQPGGVGTAADIHN